MVVIFDCFGRGCTCANFKFSTFNLYSITQYRPIASITELFEPRKSFFKKALTSIANILIKELYKNIYLQKCCFYKILSLKKH